MATLSSLLSPAQQQALTGYGTALTGGLVDRNGQTFGGGKTLDQYVQGLNAAFPGLGATIEDETGGDSGTYIGSKVNFDPSKLPAGWEQALTGPTGGIEVSDPDSHWGDGSATKFFDPSKVQTDAWGTHTGANNIYQTPDTLRDVGVWGPLLVSAVIGGAGSGLLGGFNGMSNAAAQGLVSGATGGIAPGEASIFGMTGAKLPNTFLSLGRQATSGQGFNGSSLSSLLPLATGALGLPSSVSSLASLGLNAAQGKGINPLTALLMLSRLGSGLGHG